MAMPAQQLNHSSPRGENRPASAPFFVSLFNPIARRLLRGGLPMGPNALLTVRGRTSGLDRTTPVAVVSIDGRRWVIATFGDTNWARNLRAAQQATITINRRAEAVASRELSPTEAEAFYRDTLLPFVNSIPLGLGRFLLGSLLGAKEMLTDPHGAALHHPVFELRPATSGGDPAGEAPPAG
ncbi:MAG TPA: nitroreductase family deazaflavin-dependent oxidoreductase [Candidatus Dormibacteraeota bacterium]